MQNPNGFQVKQEDALEVELQKSLARFDAACEQLKKEIRTHHPEATDEEIGEAIGYLGAVGVLVRD